MWLNILTLCVLFTMTPCDPVIKNLCSVPGNENYLDSYYVCDTCGGTVHWFVNGSSAGAFGSDSTAGTTRAGSLAGGIEYRYSTVLLLIGNTTCRTVLLVVSHPYGENLNVVCRGKMEIALTNDFCQRPVSVRNNGAELYFVRNNINVVPPYSTFLFTCNIPRLSMHWLIDGVFIWDLNSQQNSDVLLLESGTTAVVILINDQPEAENGADQSRNLTSVLVVLDDNLTDSFNATCASLETSVTYAVRNSNSASSIADSTTTDMNNSSTATGDLSTQHMESSTTCTTEDSSGRC